MPVAAGRCLPRCSPFLIPEFLLDSARREPARKSRRANKRKNLPFIFVPSIFIRYSLLAFVTIIGFVMAFEAGRGISVFLPFALISLSS